MTTGQARECKSGSDEKPWLRCLQDLEKKVLGTAAGAAAAAAAVGGKPPMDAKEGLDDFSSPFCCERYDWGKARV